MKKNFVFLFDNFSSDRADFPFQNNSTNHAPDAFINNSHLSSFYQEITDDNHKFFFETDIRVKIEKIDNCQMDRDNVYFYPIELSFIKFSELFNSTKTTTIDFLRRNDISILFYFPAEGFPCVGTPSFNQDWLLWISKQLIKHNLHKNRKYLISGNLKIQEDYRKFFKNTKTSPLVPFTEVFPVSYFEFKLNQNNEFSYDFSLDDKIYDFLSYNSNFRYGRVALCSEVIRKNLNSNSLFSFIGGNDVKFEDQISLSLELLDDEGKEFLTNYIKRWSPLIIDIDKDEKSTKPYSMNVEHYSKTCYSLVSETEISSDTVFITEKTFKPIKAYHPFIVFGSPHTLKTLRSMGYHTFPELFDESYDNEFDPKIRLKMILHEVKRVNDIPINDRVNFIEKKLKEKLIHNKKNLDSQDRYRTQLKEIFLKMYTTEMSFKKS